MLAPQLVAGDFINLLSGEFAPQIAAGSGWRRWRLAAILAAALFVVHVGGLSLAWLQSHRSERQLDAQIGEIGAQRPARGFRRGARCAPVSSGVCWRLQE